MLYYIMIYYNLMGRPLCMRSIVDRNFIMWHMTWRPWISYDWTWHIL